MGPGLTYKFVNDPPHQFLPLYADMKRVAILVDSQQPEPPTVAEVEQVLTVMMTAPTDTVDALLGDMPEEEGSKERCVQTLQDGSASIPGVCATVCEEECEA